MEEILSIKLKSTHPLHHDLIQDYLPDTSLLPQDANDILVRKKAREIERERERSENLRKAQEYS